MTQLSQCIRSVPLAHDPDRADGVLATVDTGLRAGPLRDLLHGTAGSSPYLARLIERHADWVMRASDAPTDRVLPDLLSELRHEIRAADTQKTVRVALRRTKARAALWIALLDLGGCWSLEQVTAGLTDLADTFVTETARWLIEAEINAGRLPGLALTDLEAGAGYVILAMGKMGAGELNYSSDIDLIALFDETRFGVDDVLDARARYIHVTKNLVRMLSDNEDGGYAFRTDLRLRPAPSTTPVCMATEAAERYYESVGRTWERAAHIKARPLVDTAAGDRYLRDLTPFIWRRHLDFAAIDDIHDMLRKIRAQKARFTPGSLPGHDLKLGPGGIREIEFFAQTRQLIVGGRDASLRVGTTKGALDALTEAGWINPEVRDRLHAHYTTLRTVEHRLQMMEDAQTHSVPKSPEARARLAALCGHGDVQKFEAELTDCLRQVHDICEELFTPGQSPVSTKSHTPDEDALTNMGFTRPGDALRQIERWHDGKIPATRGDRARDLFRSIEPQIIKRLAGAADPDQALVYFDRFLSGLPAGVQVFSLFHANPQLLDLIVEICAAAPRLAQYLGRHAHTLDALLDRDFWAPLPDLNGLKADLTAYLAGEQDYERVLDASRRWAREQWFRAGVQTLRGLSDQREAGIAFSHIAEACLCVLCPHVIDNFARRHGPPPGIGMAVLALGKMGSQEMTARSDLDLIIVYDADGIEASEGVKPLTVGAYYPRLTQALVAALTAQTAEGALYEVDMRLRPSGRSGPVAVSMAAFSSYQKTEAWVWEHLALTRARVIFGPPRMRADIETTINEALGKRVGASDVLHEAGDMRRRLIAANSKERPNPWSLKHAAGGLMEIEFVLQTGILLHGLETPVKPPDAVPDLVARGWLNDADGDALLSALGMQQLLQQMERVALDGEIDPQTVGAELENAIVRALQIDSFTALEEDLKRRQGVAADICDRLVPTPSEEAPDQTGS